MGLFYLRIGGGNTLRKILYDNIILIKPLKQNLDLSLNAMLANSSDDLASAFRC